MLVTQNVDDLHLRAEWESARLPSEKMVQIHGDIFVTRCSRCEFRYCAHEADSLEIPKCRECGALMRPGVVWFGEQLDISEIQRVESFLAHGPCDVVLVIGTTAMFGYVVDWAVRGAGQQGQLIEVNPEITSLSEFATQSVREPAAIALPGVVDRILGARTKL